MKIQIGLIVILLGALYYVGYVSAERKELNKALQEHAVVIEKTNSENLNRLKNATVILEEQAAEINSMTTTISNMEAYIQAEAGKFEKLIKALEEKGITLEFKRAE